MIGHNLWLYLIVIFFIILCENIDDKLLSSKLSLSKNFQSITLVSLLKATANYDRSDSGSLNSFDTVSLGSDSKDTLSISDSSDQSDSSSVASVELKSKNKKKKLFGFSGNLFKSKSSPEISSPSAKKGLKSQLLNMFKKKNKGGKHGKSLEDITSSEEELRNKKYSSSEGLKKEVDTDDEDDEEEEAVQKPLNPNLEKISESDNLSFDLGIMQLYLESQVVSSNSQINKAKEILQINKEIYRTVRKEHNRQMKDSKCKESLLESVFTLSNQIYLAKSFCQMASIKITNETGFCRNRCRIINSKSCKTCKEAFGRKEKCKAISNTIDSMFIILEKIIKNCLIKNSVQMEDLSAFILYKSHTPYKCTKEQYRILKGKLEAKAYQIALKVSIINNIVKQKNICNSCTRQECLSCTSMAYCSQCPGLEDLSSCSNCLAAQNLQSTLILERNQLIKEGRRIFSKILSCESFLALTSKETYNIMEPPTESEVGKILEEKVNLVLSRYLAHSILGHSHFKPDVAERSKTYQKLPADIKNAILSGVKLKAPSKQKAIRDQSPTQLSEAFNKHKKRKEKYGISGGEYKIPSMPPPESTDEEKKLAIALFERGICTYLMIILLNQELRSCNIEIDDRSSQHDGCENCRLDGCRMKRCSNFPEIRSLIMKRESLSEQIQRCNEYGFISQTELKAKIDEIKNSGLLSVGTTSGATSSSATSSSATSSGTTVAQVEKEPEEDEDEDGDGNEDGENEKDEITRL
ncbi:putative Secreted Protein [Cryptosporidium tyzzeri]|nr:putative Secreted Protein [Cryptosporidium tyzzeri]